MAQALVITLREGLEMALVVVVVLALLGRMGRRDQFSYVWWGVGAAILLSVVAGGLLFALGFAFEGRAEDIFEGVAMLLAAGVLTWMVVWMRRQARHIRGELERQVREAVAAGSTLTLASIAFLAVGREGLETALFLFTAVKTSTPFATFIGAVIGLVIAGLLGLGLYRGSRRLNIGLFFNVTGVFVILFAAGLLVRGLHEFQEVGFLPIVIEHVWDINGLLSEREGLGAFLKSLLGYNGNPSLMEVITYPVYLILALFYLLRPLPATIANSGPSSPGGNAASQSDRPSRQPA